MAGKVTCNDEKAQAYIDRNTVPIGYDAGFGGGKIRGLFVDIARMFLEDLVNDPGGPDGDYAVGWVKGEVTASVSFRQVFRFLLAEAGRDGRVDFLRDGTPGSQDLDIDAMVDRLAKVCLSDPALVLSGLLEYRGALYQEGQADIVRPDFVVSEPKNEDQLVVSIPIRTMDMVQNELSLEDESLTEGSGVVDRMRT